MRLARLGLVSTSLLSLAVLAEGAPAPAPPPLLPLDPGQYRNGPTRSGYFPAAKLPTKPKVLWTHRTESEPGDPVVVGGVVYFQDRGAVVHAIRVDTGNPVWVSGQFERWANTEAAVAVSAGRVFVGTRSGVTALDAATGKSVWQSAIDRGADQCGPLVVEGRVYVGGADGNAYCLGADTGQVIWKQDILATNLQPGPRPADDAMVFPRTASTDGARLFFPLGNRARVVVLELATGRPLWAYQAGLLRATWGTPVVSGGAAFVPSAGGRVAAVERGSGRTVWTYREPEWDWSESELACRGGAGFMAAYNLQGGRVVRLELADGRPRWEYLTPAVAGKPNRLSAGPVVTDDAVVFGSHDGHVYCLDSETGALRWRLEPVEGWRVPRTPCTDGSRLFVPVHLVSKQQRETGAIVCIGEAP